MIAVGIGQERRRSRCLFVCLVLVVWMITAVEGRCASDDLDRMTGQILHKFEVVLVEHRAIREVARFSLPARQPPIYFHQRTKFVINDPGGDPWIFKARTLEVAQRIETFYLGSLLFGGDFPETFVIPLVINGKKVEGEIERFVKDASSLVNLPLDRFTPEMIERLQIQQIIDWLFASTDTDSSNFLLTRSGRVVPIDRCDALWDFPSDFTPDGSICRVLGQAFKEGEIRLDVAAPGAFVRLVERIGPGNFRHIVEEIAGYEPSLVERIMAKRDALRGEVEKYYRELGFPGLEAVESKAEADQVLMKGVHRRLDEVTSRYRRWRLAFQQAQGPDRAGLTMVQSIPCWRMINRWEGDWERDMYEFIRAIDSRDRSKETDVESLAAELYRAQIRAFHELPLLIFLYPEVTRLDINPGTLDIRDLERWLVLLCGCRGARWPFPELAADVERSGPIDMLERFLIDHVGDKEMAHSYIRNLESKTRDSFSTLDSLVSGIIGTEPERIRLNVEENGYVLRNRARSIGMLKGEFGPEMATLVLAMFCDYTVQYDDAFALYQDVIDGTDPLASFLAHLRMGILFSTAPPYRRCPFDPDAGRAMEKFLSAKALFPESGLVHVNLAVGHLFQGDPDRAIHHLREVRRIDQSRFDSWYRSEESLDKLSMAAHDTRVRVDRLIWSLLDGDSHHILALACGIAGDPERAERHMGRAEALGCPRSGPRSRRSRYGCQIKD